ncbi:multiple RNA-binding domain-containing protein 1 [Trichonephila clavata]|uniref:Multiple RNA-binding domain-containing protein 1 n=1 Tax=Trichonephila clavata TaxID=2740835 RepID=A0A8X6HZV1_TRICU|nr:multiple RNA-binding domain-containing protein 1 [Trichonephila clavata]
MVKKRATPSKRGQAKKAFEVDNDYDSDFDGDSGEEMVVQKTPKNKTPQGQNSQSMSAKKVNFELSGKKTPGKTPQKNNSFIGKKQPTPVAKGMKGVQKKKPQSEEMDDDDDEDDDDFELDMDEDDSDDDEEEEQIQKQKSNSKQLMKLNPKQTPKGKSSSKDFDGDSDEEMVVQKTPQGRNSQSMSAKKVKTPGKIPQKNNSFIGKKQLTPVAKGMKGNKGLQKKKPLGEKMDDDEEEDDSDFELDMDDIDMSDDDEDCENMDDVDDEDDEEGEEQAQIQKQKSNSKQERNDVKTQKKIKDADKSEEPQMPISRMGTKQHISDGEWNLALFVGNLPIDVNRDELKALSSDILDVVVPQRFRRFAHLIFASEEKVDANYKTLQGKELRGHLLNIDYTGAKSKNFHPKIKEEQNLKSLYVGNIPIGVTLDELKALSSDIEDVYMSPKSETNRNPYAFIRFASEEKADANCKALQGVKLKGQVLKIDYAGHRGSKMASSNALQLCIRQIPLSATLGDVATHFPKATQVAFNKSTGLRTAFVTFFKQEDAAEAFNLKEIEIDGHMLNLKEYHSAPYFSSKREDFKNFKHERKGNFRKRCASPPAKSVSPPAKRLVESLPERPVTPLERVDPSVLMTGAHVEVTSHLPTPPLMTRCNKSTQAYSSHLELGKRLLEQPPFLPNKKLAIQPKTPAQPIHTIVLFVPDHHPLLKSGMCRSILHPVKNVNK